VCERNHVYCGLATRGITSACKSIIFWCLRDIWGLVVEGR